MNADDAAIQGLIQATAEQVIMLGREVTSDELIGAIAKLNSHDTSGLVARAESAIAQDNIDQALAHALQASLASPGRQDVRACLDSIVFSSENTTGELSQSLQDFLDTPEDPIRCLSLGSALRNDQRREEALLAFRRALEADPGEGECWRSLAAIMRDEGHYEAGMIFAIHFLREHPEDAWGHVQHANLLARLNRRREAIDAYRQAIALEPGAAGVQSAIARQYILKGDMMAAKTEFHGAIHDDPNDYRALEGLADVLTKLGRHAEAVMWYRRAQSERPGSKTLRYKLASSLLLRQHWGEGRKLLGLGAKGPDDGQPPVWEGQRTREGRLLVRHDPNALPSETMIGLGMARHIADAGQAVLCLCPMSLIDLVAAPPRNLTLIAFDSESAKTLSKGDDIAAQITFDNLAAFGEWASTPLSPWLRPPKPTRASRTKRIAYISGELKHDTLPDLDKIRERIGDGAGMHAVYMQARPTIEKTLTALKSISFVVTDDPLTGLIAAARGCPSAILLPGNCPWWWRDHGQVSPWAENQTLLRCLPNMDGSTIDEFILQAIKAAGTPPPHERAIRPSSGPTELAETLDRLTPLLEPHESRLVGAEALTGGTRNEVYRIRCETGDRVIRLSRFPAPRKGFYVKENNNMQIAARAGLSPRVDFADGLDGSMMLEFIDGKTMRSADLRKMENAEAVGRIFRKLHQLPGFKDSFDILAKVERNTARLHRRSSKPFIEQQSFNDLMTRVIGILRSHGVPHYATHNDPLTRNFILRDGVMILIDWECSGLGDPHWEVAAMSAQAGLDRDVWEAYMVSYFGSMDHPGICRVPLFEAICRYFWWTDALSTGINDPDDPSWRDKAKRWWGWFTEVVGANDFDAHVEKAERYRWEPAHSPGSPDFDK